MKPCVFLLAAGLLDAILTHIGIVAGLIEEGNPLMRLVMEQSWFTFYLIKIFLPLILLGLYYFRPFKGIVRILLYSTCFLYLSILGYHMVWISLNLNPST
ncbi:DUF5658 family protein [Neobacillus jeddahensis]|uniref:DUF5658 family protein n=1 Tax=Neobacillus jeddahensis TaxID=1461580 RepID=UPI000693BB2D|nr:DUF5658 family protein [Neobacillus jeddahensis]